jgi:hypothetical protein
MGKGGGDQTVTQTVDPATQRYVAGTRGIAGQGERWLRDQDPSQFLLGPTAAGQQGINILQNLGIGPQGVADWMNPYAEQMRGVFDYQRDAAATQAQKAATAAGVWGGGGGRAGVQQALDAVGRREQEWQANAYQQAVQNMFAGGQFGLQQAQGLLGAGEYERSLAERQAQAPLWQYQQRIGMRNQALGPYGTTSTQEMQGNPMGGALGGAVTGAGLGFGVPGAIIGGGLGLLGGLFG